MIYVLPHFQNNKKIMVHLHKRSFLQNDHIVQPYMLQECANISSAIFTIGQLATLQQHTGMKYSKFINMFDDTRTVSKCLTVSLLTRSTIRGQYLNVSQ
jgi:hypothetical protein